MMQTAITHKAGLPWLKERCIDRRYSDNDEPCVDTAQETDSICDHRLRKEGYVNTKFFCWFLSTKLFLKIVKTCHLFFEGVSCETRNNFKFWGVTSIYDISPFNIAK